MDPSILVFAAIVLIPILLIIGIYRLMNAITYRKSRRHDIAVDEEQRKESRVFRDE